MFKLSEIKWGSGSTEPETETPAQEQGASEQTENTPENQPEQSGAATPGTQEGGSEETPLTPPPTEPQTPPEQGSLPAWKEKFEKPEDIWAAYNELASREPKVREVEKVVEKQIEDELLKGLVEYYEQGGDLAKYLEAKVVNYDTFSDEDILRIEFEKKYPDLGKQEVSRLFQRHLEKSYNIGEDADESEMELAKIQMKADASQVRRSLKDEQSKFKLPEPKQVATNNGPTAEELQAAEDQRKALEAMLNPVLSKYSKEKKITVKYGNDSQPLNYELKDWDAIEDIAKNDQKFFNLFVTGDENNPVDFDKWIETIAFAKDPEGYKRSLISYGKNLGTEKVVNEITNPGTPNAKPSSTGPASLFDAMKAAVEASARK